MLSLFFLSLVDWVHGFWNLCFSSLGDTVHWVSHIGEFKDRDLQIAIVDPK